MSVRRKTLDPPANKTERGLLEGGPGDNGAIAFWEDTLRYLYLPRLKNRDVLAQAISSGAASLDSFGTPYGQHDDRFDGFQFGSGNVQLDNTLLLIEPDAARRYEESHCKKEVSSLEAVAGLGETQLETGSPGAVPIVADGARKTRDSAAGSSPSVSFHGTAEVAPATAKMRLVQIGDEIVSVLGSDPNAGVKVVVEISAEFPDGAKDTIKRAVSENAQSLGLKNADWE
jgi:hypothetical protein